MRSPSKLCSMAVWAVSRTTGIWHVSKFSLISLHSSVPDNLGIITSLNTRLGCSDWTFSQPSAPLEAVITV